MCSHTQLILPFPDISELLGFAGQEPFCKNTHKTLSQCLEKAETGSFYLRHPRLKTSFPHLPRRAWPCTPWNPHAWLCHGHILSHASLFSRWTATQSLRLSLCLSLSLFLSLKAMLCSPHSTPGCGCVSGLVPETDSDAQRARERLCHTHLPHSIAAMLTAYSDLCSYNTMVQVLLVLSLAIIMRLLMRKHYV